LADQAAAVQLAGIGVVDLACALCIPKIDVVKIRWDNNVLLTKRPGRKTICLYINEAYSEPNRIKLSSLITNDLEFMSYNI
jgi:hypothetical protein